MNTLGIGSNYLAFAGKTAVYFKELPKNSLNEGNGDSSYSCGTTTLPDLPDLTFSSEWIARDGHIECIAISKDDKTVAVADSMHGLHLFELESTNKPTWIQIFKGTSNKRVIKLQFTSDGQYITFLDKQGDIYATCITDDRSKISNAKKLMGHTSFISDYVVRIESKQIISCDRDEKIRVSNFPDAFVIQGFKLGHTESLINAACLELKDNNGDRKVYLISVSLTGTILLWDLGKPVIGTETDFLKKMNIKELLGEKMKEAEVKIMKAVFAGGTGYLGIVFTGSPKIHIFRIVMSDFSLELLHEFETNSENIVIEWSNSNRGTLIIYKPDVGSINWWRPGGNGLRCEPLNELSESIISDIKASTESLKPGVVPMKKRRTNLDDEGEPNKDITA